MPSLFSLIALPKLIQLFVACVLMNITIFDGCDQDMQQLATSLINTASSGLIDVIGQFLDGLIQVGLSNVAT